jgi:methylmalonyl-CoA/ethylmalonyl-CoA epimerase
MIGRLNHVAIAVRDIAKASDVYRTTLGAQVSEKGRNRRLQSF